MKGPWQCANVAQSVETGTRIRQSNGRRPGIGPAGNHKNITTKKPSVPIKHRGFENFIKSIPDRPLLAAFGSFAGRLPAPASTSWAT